jgi:hypothetical protein
MYLLTQVPSMFTPRSPAEHTPAVAITIKAVANTIPFFILLSLKTTTIQLSFNVSHKLSFVSPYRTVQTPIYFQNGPKLHHLYRNSIARFLQSK